MQKALEMTPSDLQKWRKQMHFSRKEAAKMLDLSYQHYCHLERGDRGHVTKVIEAACYFFLVKEALVWMIETDIFKK